VLLGAGFDARALRMPEIRERRAAVYEIDTAEHRFMAGEGGPRSRVVFTFGEGSFDPETAAERTLRLGFGSCEELAGDELWRRYLPGHPHPYALAMKVEAGVDAAADVAQAARPIPRFASAFSPIPSSDPGPAGKCT
jgi:hypothetical protein